MGIKPPKPEHRTNGQWTPHVFHYEPEKHKNIHRLRGLRTHPERNNPNRLAQEILVICQERPPYKWSPEEKQAFVNLFGNNCPSLGTALTTAIGQVDLGLSQMLARPLTNSDLDGRRAKRAAMHGKRMDAISRLKLSTQQRLGIILN